MQDKETSAGGRTDSKLLSTDNFQRIAEQGVYRIKPITCPKCGEKIELMKPRNRVPVHSYRMAKLAEHYREVH